MFLVLSKLFALAVSLIVLVATLRDDDALGASAEIVTAVGTAVGSLEVALALLLVTISFLHQIRQYFKRGLLPVVERDSLTQNLTREVATREPADAAASNVAPDPRQLCSEALISADSNLRFLMDVDRWSAGGLEFGHSLLHTLESLRSETAIIDRLQHLVEAAVHSRRSARASCAAGAVPHGDPARCAAMPPGLWAHSGSEIRRGLLM